MVNSEDHMATRHYSELGIMTNIVDARGGVLAAQDFALLQ